MHYPKWFSLLTLGAAAGGMLFFGGLNASAADAVPLESLPRLWRRPRCRNSPLRRRKIRAAGS